jgi:hypothetical protein
MCAIQGVVQALAITLSIYSALHINTQQTDVLETSLFSASSGM